MDSTVFIETIPSKIPLQYMCCAASSFGGKFYGYLDTAQYCTVGHTWTYRVVTRRVSKYVKTVQHIMFM